MEIENLIARRTDLSTFLVHLTRDGDDETAKERLKKILTSGKLLARNPYGQAVQALKKAGVSTKSQNCVCFTETPLEHVHLLTNKIDSRKFHFRPYGVAITKKQGRRKGVNPIWYLDITMGHDWLTKPFSRLVDAAIEAGKFEKSDIAKLAPFIEQMGSGPKAGGRGGYRKEFWWEREWRHVGDFSLPHRCIVLCPKGDIAEIKKVVEKIPDDDRLVEPAYIDPSWSLEQIIGQLAGLDNSDIGPL